MKQHTNDYFEGILQIREGNKELLKWIHNRIISDGKARVAKEKIVKNGVDIYISDQHYLQNLGRKIQDSFSGILKTSKRLHTVDKMTSKHLYRVTVLFKVLPFKRGDIVEMHGEKVQILSIGKRIQIKVLQTGQKKDIIVENALKTIK